MESKANWDIDLKRIMKNKNKRSTEINQNESLHMLVACFVAADAVEALFIFLFCFYFDVIFHHRHKNNELVIYINHVPYILGSFE